MSAQHTPGPWHVVPYGDGDSLVICSDQGGEWRICFMATHGGALSSWQAIQANARLIAAAPALLEALQRMKSAGYSVLSAMDDHNSEHGTHLGGSAFFEMGRAIHTADDAIVKAIGVV